MVRYNKKFGTKYTYGQYVGKFTMPKMGFKNREELDYGKIFLHTNNDNELR